MLSNAWLVTTSFTELDRSLQFFTIHSRISFDVSKMQSAEDSNQEKYDDCPSCFHRRENLQAIGVSIFFVSLFSCGLLLPVSLPAAMVIQSLLFMKCKHCRDRAKREQRAKRESQSLCWKLTATAPINCASVRFPPTSCFYFQRDVPGFPSAMNQAKPPAK